MENLSYNLDWFPHKKLCHFWFEELKLLYKLLQSFKLISKIKCAVACRGILWSKLFGSLKFYLCHSVSVEESWMSYWYYKVLIRICMIKDLSKLQNWKLQRHKMRLNKNRKFRNTSTQSENAFVKHRHSSNSLSYCGKLGAWNRIWLLAKKRCNAPELITFYKWKKVENIISSLGRTPSMHTSFYTF